MVSKAQNKEVKKWESELGTKTSHKNFPCGKFLWDFPLVFFSDATKKRNLYNIYFGYIGEITRMPWFFKAIRKVVSKKACLLACFLLINIHWHE